MSEIQVGQINSTDGSTAITTGADGYVSFAKTQIGGRRNLIINGAMQVAQRGTSGTDSDTYPCADRWRMAGAGTPGEFDVTVESDAPDGFAKSLKFNCTTSDSLAAGDYRYLNQRLEGQDLQGVAKGTSSAKSLTVSFWVKSNVTGTYICGIFDTDNSRYVGQSYTIDASATWEYKTVTFPADTTGSFDNDNNASIRMSWFIAAGSNYTSGTLATSWESNTAANYAVGQTNLASDTNNYWQITGVQLEVGTVATPFEHRSFGEELQLCSRYYQKSYEYSVSPGATTYFGINGQTGSVAAATTSYLVDEIKFPVRMRDDATVTVYDSVGNQGKCTRELPGTATYTNENVAANYPSETGASLMSVSGTNSAYIYFHYTAEAEL